MFVLLLFLLVGMVMPYLSRGRRCCGSRCGSRCGSLICIVIAIVIAIVIVGSVVGSVLGSALGHVFWRGRRLHCDRLCWRSLHGLGRSWRYGVSRGWDMGKIVLEVGGELSK